MPQDLDGSSSFSICVPTYNRARLLERSLSHLLSYADQSFELIIGDNHSPDDTPQVIASLAAKFRHLVVLRHGANLGFSRNMDAILRRATRPYVYILSDDDFLFEGALTVVKYLMESRPEVAAIVGRYTNVDRLVETTAIDYRDAKFNIVAARDYGTLLDNFEVCDGHPFMRRELFQRHCAYWERTIGLLPLYMRLLEHGSLAVVDKPFFQHLTNTDSISTSMTEAWMLDMANADLEIALSFPESRALRDKLGATRQRFLQTVYLQSARMARNKGLPHLLWMFLKRLDSVQGADDDLMVKAEAAFMHDFLVARAAQIVCDAGFSSVHYDETPVLESLVQAMTGAGPCRESGIQFRRHPHGSTVPPTGLRLVEAFTPDPMPVHVLALQDLFGQLRLSRFGGRLAAFEGRLIVHYDDLATAKLMQVPNPLFQSLCARYQASAKA